MDFLGLPEETAAGFHLFESSIAGHHVVFFCLCPFFFHLLQLLHLALPQDIDFCESGSNRGHDREIDLYSIELKVLGRGRERIYKMMGRFGE